MAIHLGTSGWSYKEWKEVFYPPKTAAGNWLSYYATKFDCTEINMSFYHLPKPSTVEQWSKKVPKSFRFCPKMSRYVTHIKRLKETEDSLNKFFDVFEPLKEQCGPVLLQLPPTLKFDQSVVRQFFQLLAKKHSEYTYALEARHESWVDEEAMSLLTEYQIAWVISQSGVGFPYNEAVTAPRVYLRFHGPGKLFASSYSDTTLQDYAQKIKTWSKKKLDVWAFFNNTMDGIAIQNLRKLDEMTKESSV